MRAPIINNKRKLLGICKKNDIVYLGVFGSFAKGKGNKNSDIDLALIIDDYTDDFETQIKLMTLREGDETIIEPHIFNKKDFKKNNPFINEIINSGIRIKIN